VGDGLGSWGQVAARRSLGQVLDSRCGDGQRVYWQTNDASSLVRCTGTINRYLIYPSCVGLCCGKRRSFLERRRDVRQSVLHRSIACEFYAEDEGVIKGLRRLWNTPETDRQSEKRSGSHFLATTWKRIADSDALR